MAGKTDDLRLVAARLQTGAGGRGRRSPVYQWLFQRADVFQRLLDDTQPSWKSVAEALIDLDLRDGTGKPPTPECVRQAWSAVKKARRVKPAPLLALADPGPPAAAAIPSTPSPAMNQPSSSDARARFRAQFKAATIRNDKPKD